MAEYEETFIAVLMASGLPRMQARVLTCLFVTDTRLEDVARFLDFISGSITRAAEQAREGLHARPGALSPEPPGPDREGRGDPF
ncbi:hypothetical protein ACIQ7S_16130 [Streptomyces griseoluteus]|uniref:hypothetical protein n=1 Tax=Streptomyces griseoluteus TaxID=29306 RepID=UPI0037F96780